MCELCGEAANSGDQENVEEIMALLESLFGPNEVIDYFDEYRTESEADLTGTSVYGGWKVSVAKVGGGTVGQTYPADEDWILQAYENGELVVSKLAAPPYPVTHEQALREAAEYWFDYQG
jgi:hypothetical protein